MPSGDSILSGANLIVSNQRNPKDLITLKRMVDTNSLSMNEFFRSEAFHLHEQELKAQRKAADAKLKAELLARDIAETARWKETQERRAQEQTRIREALIRERERQRVQELIAAERRKLQAEDHDKAMRMLASHVRITQARKDRGVEIETRVIDLED